MCLYLCPYVCSLVCACYFEAQRNRCRCLERNRKCYKCSLSPQNFITTIDHKQLTGCQAARLHHCSLVVDWAAWRYGNMWLHCGCHGWTLLHALSYAVWRFHSVFLVKWLQQSRRSLIMAPIAKSVDTHEQRKRRRRKCRRCGVCCNTGTNWHSWSLMACLSIHRPLAAIRKLTVS